MCDSASHQLTGKQLLEFFQPEHSPKDLTINLKTKVRIKERFGHALKTNLVCIFTVTGKNQANKSSVKKLIHCLGAYINMGRENCNVRVRMVPTDNPCRRSGGDGHSVSVGRSGGQQLRVGFHPILLPIRPRLRRRPPDQCSHVPVFRMLNQPNPSQLLIESKPGTASMRFFN